MASKVDERCLYADTHEWVRVEGERAYVGISDHAQQELSDVVYVELPEIGSEVEKGDELAIVESVKAASEVYAPISGTVVEVNEALPDAPEAVNESPYDEGWFVCLEIADQAELEKLMSAEEYASSQEKA